MHVYLSQISSKSFLKPWPWFRIKTRSDHICSQGKKFCFFSFPQHMKTEACQKKARLCHRQSTEKISFWLSPVTYSIGHWAISNQGQGHGATSQFLIFLHLPQYKL